VSSSREYELRSESDAASQAYGAPPDLSPKKQTKTNESFDLRRKAHEMYGPLSMSKHGLYELTP